MAYTVRGGGGELSPQMWLKTRLHRNNYGFKKNPDHVFLGGMAWDVFHTRLDPSGLG